MKNILHFIIMLFVTLQIQAQQKEITGTIIDGDSLPLPGVNVIVKGTQNGTITDFDGYYSIITKVDDVIVYSYVGNTEERKVKEVEIINLIMIEKEELEDWFCRPLLIHRIKPEVTYQYVTIKL
ncbi:carboxypeptidase-like regulatory domain-containing protein [Lacinutrix chionoecetis]